MANITRFMIIPYNTKQMFTLVNNIKAYSEFIPFCTDSRVLHKRGREITAKINVYKAGVKNSITTRNICMKNKSIIMYLVEGPFLSFYGSWKFIPLNVSSSIIECYFNFEFQNKLIEISFGFFFKEIINKMIIAFINRAKEVYKS